MKQEIDRKIKKMKREEMARINLLVERAMAADPRLRREKEKERQEKAAKEEVSNIALQSTKEYVFFIYNSLCICCLLNQTGQEET
jgi:hypothetical protein